MRTIEKNRKNLVIAKLLLLISHLSFFSSLKVAINFTEYVHRLRLLRKWLRVDAMFSLFWLRSHLLWLMLWV